MLHMSSSNLSLNEFQVRYLALFLFLVIDGFGFLLFLVIDASGGSEKSSQEYPVNAGVLQGSIIGPTLFLLHINYLPDYVICNITTYVDDTALYSKCDQASNLWQQLELASELESDLRDTVDWCKKWLVDFNSRKTNLV